MEQDGKRFFMASDPRLFEPFEVTGIADPKVMACIRSVIGERYGNLLYVLERSNIEIPAEHRERMKLPEDILISEYKYIVLLRWDSMGWKPLIPSFKMT